MEQWDAGAAGVMVLPSGRRIRGRGLGRPMPAGPPPTLTVRLSVRRPAELDSDQCWIQWRDFWVPADFGAADQVLRSAYERAASERVEIACRGGVGRTGTALAALAIFDGLSDRDAVTWARQHYHRRAVEVPWQRWFLRWLVSSGPGRHG